MLFPSEKNAESKVKVVALAGNPNVGKSTVFNALTGMNQHTGNWPGKTVSNAQGKFFAGNTEYLLVDIPGTYSLAAHSAEEEIARNFICFGGADTTVAVCDATCLERNLNLVLQILEVTDKVIVCINLMDEARRKKITIDTDKLSEKLGVPIVSTFAHKKKSLIPLTEKIETLSENTTQKPYITEYPEPIEKALAVLVPAFEDAVGDRLNPRWAALRALEADEKMEEEIKSFIERDIFADSDIAIAMVTAEMILKENGISRESVSDIIVSSLVGSAEKICADTVHYENRDYCGRDRKIDRFLTGKAFGIPIMIALLLVVFWITIVGANYPSELLSKFLFGIGDRLRDVFVSLNTPEWLIGIVADGAYRVLAWVVSVMLPPMAIFFPLFTILEDSGYLPRIAYNLDKPFKKCSACGKQALTMCMGFGCNAAGITGCRIIDSPRERLIAMLTNNFVPCNGRFPAIIALISVFFVGASAGGFETLLSSVLLTCFILLGIAMTFLSSKLLSKTLLKGIPSSFALELPPYRKPQFLKVIVRSIFDRTLFVLGRAAAVAAPAGAFIWIAANIQIDGITLLSHITAFLDPFARIFGLDGVILTAFILGIPANETVIPIMIMAYTANGTLNEISDLSFLQNVFTANGWTQITAINVILFSLMHWPCSTALMTIKKESGSIKWTIAAFLLPTVIGLLCCLIINAAASLF